MLRPRLHQHHLLSTIALLAACSVPAAADTVQDKFHHAYYLETADGNLAAAAKLYEEIVATKGADPQTLVAAKTRLAGCREELKSVDFAQLMPPEALAYIELNRPGDQVLRLLEKLGLTSEPGEVAKKGGNRVAISPALVKEVFGIRGAAIAITGFDPSSEQPAGVAVFHPGNVEVIRGMIETALPIACKSVKPIGGYATWQIEDDAYVTLTSRLVIVSNATGDIEDVIERLKGEEKQSLATNEAMAEVLKDRQSSLLFFCVNAKPVMPLVNAALAAAGSESKELAIAQAVLDLNSIKALAGRVGVGDDGLFLDVSLRLDKGHKNLAFNLLRMPSISEQTLHCIPQGAAAFVVGALNEAPSRFGTTPTAESEGPQIVTAFDIGREIFSNIVGYGVFVLPPDGEKSAGGPPIPDIGAAFTVKDPAKTRALWTQVLGIASLAAGTGVVEGTPIEIEGIQVRRYSFPDKINIFLASAGNDVIIAPKQSVIARALASRKANKSIRDDATFAANMKRVGPDSTLALFAHAGRCAQIAKSFMDAGDLKEAEPWMNACSETAAAVVVDHSGELLRLSALVTGIPKVGDLVSEEIAREMRGDEQRNRATRLVREKKWHEAVPLLDEQIKSEPTNAEPLLLKFQALAVGKQDRDAALACADALFERMNDDAFRLNNFAWALLTETKYGGRYAEVAHRFSQRSNELSKHGNWMYVDTLALAEFERGNVERAIELEEKAIALCKDKSRVGDARAALNRFKAKLAKAEGTGR